jgi:radical SAM protein with 4Fe4S-binding SPASM domain
MKVNAAVDKSYNIKEYEADPTWKQYLSSGFVAYRKNWEKASKRFLFEFPLCVEIESSYFCNLKCPMCAREMIETKDMEGTMSSSLYNKIIREAEKNKMPSIMLAHEGEPLTNPFIADMVKQASEAGIMDIWLHTNANLLTEDMSEKLIRNGLTKINFSIDAFSEETYNKVRVGGDYNKVIRNIEAFLRIKDQLKKKYIRVRVSFVAMDTNKHEMGGFFEFWKDKVNLICFQDLIDFSKFDNKGLAANKHSDYFCNRPWQLLIIRNNGDVVPCGHPLQNYKPEDYLLGNLNVNTIRECWHSKKLTELREILLQNKHYLKPFCNACVSSYKPLAD